MLSVTHAPVKNEKASLKDMDVLVVDCQTTGSSPGSSRLLEVGWALCAARDETVRPPVFRLLRLEGPDVKVPRRVAKLTGIDEGALQDAHTPEQVCTELKELLQREAPPLGIAHFARFEKSFLGALFKEFGGDAFPLPLACTHELARRLHPSLPRLTLRALCGYHGYFLPEKRRAAPHVAATFHLWRHLVRALAVEHGALDLEALWAFLATPPPKRPKKKSYLLGDSERLALPTAPGVYRFFGPRDTLLYVGKATNLRSRVSSYFTRSRGRGEHILEMLTMADRVEHEALASPLEAALKEHELIARSDPPYNRALRPSADRAFFASADFSRVCEPKGDPNDFYHGPFTSRDSLERFKELCAAVTGDDRAAMGLGAQIEAADGAALAGRDLFAESYLGACPAGGSRIAARLLALGAIRAELRALQRAKEQLTCEETKAPQTEETPKAEITSDHVAAFFASIARSVGRQWKTACALRFLSHCTVAWYPKTRGEDEPGRLITVCAGEISPGRLWRAGDEIPPPPGWQTALDKRRCLLEPLRRDRLRVLLAEIARLCREGLEVRLRLSSAPALRAPKIAALFFGDEP